MKRNNVDFEFQFRVRKYLEYCFYEENENDKEKFIFQKLPTSIRDEYYYQIYGKTILNCNFLKKKFLT